MISHMVWAPNMYAPTPLASYLDSITDDLIQRQIDRARLFARLAEDRKLDFYEKSPWLAFAVHLFSPMLLLRLGFLEGPNADGGELHWQWCFWRGSRAARQLWP